MAASSAAATPRWASVASPAMARTSVVRSNGSAPATASPVLGPRDLDHPGGAAARLRDLDDPDPALRAAAAEGPGTEGEARQRGRDDRVGRHVDLAHRRRAAPLLEAPGQARDGGEDPDGLLVIAGREGSALDHAGHREDPDERRTRRRSVDETVGSARDDVDEPRVGDETPCRARA